MIEKSVFEKQINQTLKNERSKQKTNNGDMKKAKLLKDISNEFKNMNNFTDYKALYESQVDINEELRQRIELLQQKIRLLQQQNRQLKTNKSTIQNEKEQITEQSQRQVHHDNHQYQIDNKRSRKQIFLQQINEFKYNLPNSMRVIEFDDLDAFHSIDLDNDQQIISKQTIRIGNNLIQQKGDSSKSDNNNGNVRVNHNKSKGTNNKITQKQVFQSSSVTMKIINDDSLIDCLCLYGLSSQTQYNEELQDSFLQGQLSYCSKTPHQIVKHTAKLMYPQNIKQNDLKISQNQQANQYAVNLITDTLKSQLKAFTLIFEPAILKIQDKRQNKNNQQKNNDDDLDDDISQQGNIQIIDLVNREKRFYAISISFQDFDLIRNKQQKKIDFQNSLQQDIYNHKLNHNVQGELLQVKSNRAKSPEAKTKLTKNIINKPSSTQKQSQIHKIKLSRKILTIFTKYPFIPFFQQLLVALLKQSFQLRKQAMRRNLSQLCNFQHSKTIDFIKIFYQKLNKQYQLSSKFEYKLNEIFEIKYLSPRMNRMENVFLQLSKSQLKSYYSEIWAYPILRLFTLDSFLDVLTMILLQEKVIFICENEHILTSTVFLFIKVLMQPFNYPYPVVSIIPNQYDYFNTPFPIVYGCINSKENLIKQKIPKLYQNVYIILSPQGIQIISHKNYSSKIQPVKSPKLRDKLLPLFIKIENLQKQSNPQKQVKQPRFSGLSSFLGFKTNIPSTKEHQKFNFSYNNRQLAHQIIEKVFLYLNAIKQKLPEPNKVGEIRKQIQNQIKTKTFTKDLKNFDMDKQTYQRIKDNLSKKTQDPFILKFLSTQIVGMEILK